MDDIIDRKQAIMLGLNTYYTGKPCGRGHDSYRYVSNHKCIMCAKENKITDRIRNNLKYKNDSAYAETVRKKSRNYNFKIKNDPERAAKNRLRKAAYAKEKRTSDALYKEREKSNVKKYRKNWSDDQKEKHRIYAKNRKATLKGAPGKITSMDVRNIFKLQKGFCSACGVDLKLGFHVDHIMPIKLGGTNYPENIQLLCPPCNLSKAAKHPDVWNLEVQKRRK